MSCAQRRVDEGDKPRASGEQREPGPPMRSVESTQTAQVEAIGHRIGDINELLLQRELCMEAQMSVLHSKMCTMVQRVETLRQGETSQNKRSPRDVKVEMAIVTEGASSSKQIASTRPVMGRP